MCSLWFILDCQLLSYPFTAPCWSSHEEQNWAVVKGQLLLKKLVLRELKLSLHPACLGMQNCSISWLYFSPRIIQTQHMTRHSMCFNHPSPWILAPLNPPARKPFFGKLTSQEQTSWLTRAVFIVGVNNNHLRYNLASEKHLQVLSTPFIVCE